MLLNDKAIKNNAGINILITWLMSKFMVKSKGVVYQVSSDLCEVNSYYSSFSDVGQKAHLPSKISEKPAWYRVNWYWHWNLSIARLIFLRCSKVAKSKWIFCDPLSYNITDLVLINTIVKYCNHPIIETILKTPKTKSVKASKNKIFREVVSRDISSTYQNLSIPSKFIKDIFSFSLLII